jgi:SRSO17 transposase
VVIDPSGFPKKGTESCGVARQWCGLISDNHFSRSTTIRIPGP